MNEELLTGDDVEDGGGVLDDFRSLARHSHGKRKELWSGAQDKGHHDELLRFVDAVKNGEESPVPFDEAVAATEATLAVLSAMRTGGPAAVGG